MASLCYVELSLKFTYSYASMTSVRVINKHLGNSKVSSVIVDINLINSLNHIKGYYPDEKLTNADVIKLTVEALHKELACLK
ncbi:hypothetical protein PE36_17785 [Moritella sp. PE36]|nr:hypothetical protein PE36_17785 [Moritella sp. PE36]